MPTNLDDAGKIAPRATTEAIHLRYEYDRHIVCGATGRVRVTRRLSDATCPGCLEYGDPANFGEPA